MTAAIAPAPERARSPRARAALDAALALVAEVGFANVTVDGIAARAGVGKATIYRYWPSKAALVVEALEALPRAARRPSSGDLRADLVVVLDALAQAVHTGSAGRILPSLVDAAERDPELAGLFARFVAQRRRCTLDHLEAAAAAGTLPAGCDVELAADLLTGPLFYRRLLSRAPVDRAYIERLVDTVLRGVGAEA
ncbi:MAG TPA: TetR/AcrR family transcriptional regulator [Acidimicrobiales bacterium]|nr:TetR/AcrR family transcriptional regulator [Acidimicrobiales bacterium]